MNFTKLKIACLLALACITAANAQEIPANSRPLSVAMDMRGDFTYDDTKGQDSRSGFHGRYLNVMVNGTIANGLTFSWRQRMNRFQHIDNDAFSSTDWVYLTYKPTQNFAIAGGKQVVLIGGYEYDAAPIDIYFSSNFWNNIACYQFGVSGSYISDNGNHTITFQVCNSPYAGLKSSLYAYNLYWSGKMGFYKSIWSVNLIEYERGKYTNFIALGNRFDFGPFNLEADFMNRAVAHHKFIRDVSIIGKAEMKVTPWLTLMAKGGYDNINIDPESQSMWPGGYHMVSKPFYGGGLEFFPMHGSRNLRIHAVGYRVNDSMGLRTAAFSVGVKWRVSLFERN